MQSSAGSTSSQHEYTLTWCPYWCRERHATLLSSYRHISLTIGKLFEKLLITRVFREIYGRGLLHDEQLWFRYRLGTTELLARNSERQYNVLRKECDQCCISRYGYSLRHRMGRRSPLQAYYPKTSHLTWWKIILLSPLPNLSKVLQFSHILTPWTAGWYRAGRIILPYITSISSVR
jgi:hypothetical protein